MYGVATISSLLKIKCRLCRLSSLLWGSFAKQTYNFKEPTNRNHPIAQYLHRMCEGNDFACLTAMRCNYVAALNFCWRRGMYVYVCVYMHVCVNVCACVFVCVCMYVYIYIYMCVCVCVIYIYIYVCVCVCVCTYIRK